VPATRPWVVRIPKPAWDALVISGRLLDYVHAEIERVMTEQGYVKMKHSRRWFWFKKSDVQKAAEEMDPGIRMP
jgi:hypothetical protein